MDINRVKSGANILWKGDGFIFHVLSFALGLFDKKWRKRDWKPWHAGYIVKILEDEEIVTSQAVGKGVEAVTYPNVESMGDCRIYGWLDNPDQTKIDDYTEKHLEEPYDALDYIWTILGELSDKLFHWPFRIVDKAETCWENLSQFDRYIGKELQPEEEPALISKMIDRLEVIQ
jgi:hypothetical protein